MSYACLILPIQGRTKKFKRGNEFFLLKVSVLAQSLE